MSRPHRSVSPGRIRRCDSTSAFEALGFPGGAKYAMGSTPVAPIRNPSDRLSSGARNFRRRVAMLDQEQTEIRLEFAKLKQDHADFDAAINAMIAMGCDALQIQRMKKKKLGFKDRMNALESRIIPDIIA